jgi:hypothetical protein
MSESLPPTQRLVCEILAARQRLGEAYWTFPTAERPVLEALAQKGLVSWSHASAPRLLQAWLTDKGRGEFLKPGYQPPADAERLAASEALREAARAIGLGMSMRQSPEEIAAAALKAAIPHLKIDIA